MRLLILVSVAIICALAQFVPQYQQHPNAVPQMQLQNPPPRFSQYSSNSQYGQTSGYGTQYGTQYGQTSSYNNGYNSNNGYTTTPSYYQNGYTTTQYGTNRLYDNGVYYNGVASTTALAAVCTAAIAYVL
ncbi:unnamed protein product [Haemonchus placei]|uniref:Conserved secreted protein n=1 Tax=Haemonchus placei TaxID=6290 RepID=A0A0N4WRN4_HAEPC|nr:unnamed protein product [Haemonchus placei]